MCQVGNALTRRKGVGVFGSALLRRELAQDGARGFGFGIGCSGVILVTRDGCRQVRIGRIGVCSVTVVTQSDNQTNQAFRQSDKSDIQTICESDIQTNQTFRQSANQTIRQSDKSVHSESVYLFSVVYTTSQLE